MLSRIAWQRRLIFNTLCVLALGSAEGIAAAPALPATPLQQAASPYAGPVNAASYQAPFRWGWFGAERVHPQIRWARDYHGDLLRSSRHRRY